ncbi:cyclic nucleotide-binding domain-containing protein [Membranicola marinus]|uniref:Cyclic nucleotide-binding domain-containing protein n=1 Tax=Membranihabitans marinus TaxID=1227546 RepID=A0A953HUF0_9BACT|nr:DUF294 nucleotidyltransferase-like domain-containing protein [Membranihabitans marinus]MBY5956656.1 cyclic nucleotide-binding domain-containing protein [Membranihabitans marinus]
MANRNVLKYRTQDFLVEYPPFSMMSEAEISLVLENIKIKYVDKGDIFFQQGDPSGDYFYIVRKGAVKLERLEGGVNILMDLCGEGDVFGIRPVIADQPYLSTGTAQEESIVYGIAVADIRKIMAKNPQVSSFLASSFASGSRTDRKNDNTDGLVFISKGEVFQDEKLSEVQSLHSSREPVTCSPDTPVEVAASIMTIEKVSSIIIINEERHPVGILTDSDIRRMVGLRRLELDQPIRMIMHSPVTCLPEKSTYAQAQMTMIQHDIGQIVLTEDGTDESEIKGVFSESEMLVYQGNSPGMIIKQMKKSRDPEELKRIRERAELLLERYLDQDVAITFISDVMTAINDALFVRAIRIARRRILKDSGRLPPVRFTWVAIGSHGRREQIIRTDQDHAIIFEEVPRNQYDSVKKYFLELANHVVEIMITCGFKECPAKMMANNPKWCLSIDEWKGQFSRWIHSPDNESILHANIFMDYRSVYGEVNLTKELTEHIFNIVHDSKIFLTYLAKYAVETPPPLSFFRNFILEKDGAHKNLFDIKHRGMLPLVDAARVLIMEQKVGRINNTIDRYEKLAEVDSKNAELYQDARDSYDVLMKLRAKNGIKNANSGRYFSPDQLSKVQRLLLRNSFKPIGQIQEVLTVRFRLKFF